MFSRWFAVWSFVRNWVLCIWFTVVQQYCCSCPAVSISAWNAPLVGQCAVLVYETLFCALVHTRCQALPTRLLLFQHRRLASGLRTIRSHPTSEVRDQREQSTASELKSYVQSSERGGFHVSPSPVPTCISCCLELLDSTTRSTTHFIPAPGNGSKHTSRTFTYRSLSQWRPLGLLPYLRPVLPVPARAATCL